MCECGRWSIGSQAWLLSLMDGVSHTIKSYGQCFTQTGGGVPQAMCHPPPPQRDLIVGWDNNYILMQQLLASYPGFSQFFNVARRKTREPGIIYHMYDLCGVEALISYLRNKERIEVHVG